MSPEDPAARDGWVACVPDPRSPRPSPGPALLLVGTTRRPPDLGGLAQDPAASAGQGPVRAPLLSRPAPTFLLYKYTPPRFLSREPPPGVSRVPPPHLGQLLHVLAHLLPSHACERDREHQEHWGGPQGPVKAGGFTSTCTQSSPCGENALLCVPA